ncbi:juvenile hormone esterase-like [Culicoides brevitarsis]|uniref:juvenile hormone esterase-like n=1 Tax=Culicoides brevitarsis TaxID=469753 RepID=UPI00307BB52D
MRGVFLLIFCYFSIVFASSDVIINTNLGSVRGKELRTWKNSQFYGFRGIRYGKPPVDDLRFKPPVPVEPWNETFDATEDGPMCPQPNKTREEYSEDCLRLNIYMKQLPCNQNRTENCSNSLKSVLFYIPGGGYYVGSGVSSDYGGPYYLLEHDIVLVTINYRLGLLGFMNMATKEYPGNAAFKDQVVAMRFVRDHITNFGGDPSKVTLISNSAGSFSTALHLVSPMSRGLFHQLIMASGGYDGKQPFASEQSEVAKKQAELFGCNTWNVNETLSCLKSKPTDDYVDTVYKSMFYGLAPWSPVVEKDFGQERFLVEQPLESFEKGNYAKVSLIAGVTRDELVENAVPIVQNPLHSLVFDLGWYFVVPRVFGYESWTFRSFNISGELRKFYGVPSPIRADNALVPLSQLISDGGVGFGTHRIAKFMEKYKPVYQYMFSYVGRYSYLYYPDDKPYGAEHADDMIYLFCRNRVAPLFNETDPEAPIIEYLTRLYTNFVKTGNPNDSNDKFLQNVTWSALSDTNRQYLNIDSELLIESDMFKDRYELWDKLFPAKYPVLDKQ